jgi:hypothetical protein
MNRSSKKKQGVRLMKTRHAFLPAILTVMAALPVQAHKAWLLPSQTVLSEQSGWITVDAAVSNDLYFFNHVPLPTQGLTVTGPAGLKVMPRNLSTGVYRTTFDLELPKPGTYRLAVAGDTFVASYRLGDETRPWRGDLSAMQAAIPAGATQVRVEHYQQRIESYVTVGKPAPLPAPTGQGVELVAVTHPNDLVAGEAAELRFLFDGKPAAGLEITVVSGGTRYRDAPQELTFKTGADGALRLTWPQPGMYWLEAAAPPAASPEPRAAVRHALYIGTFEVLPP